MNIEIGEVKKGSSLSKGIILPKKIEGIRVGCPSCTKATFEENKLTITYKAVDSRGTWSKSVTVTYSDQTTERLIYTVKVI